MSSYSKVGCFVGVKIGKDDLLVKELLPSCNHEARLGKGVIFCPECGVKVEAPQYKVTGKRFIPDLDEVLLYRNDVSSNQLMLGLYCNEEFVGSIDCFKLQNLDELKVSVLHVLKENKINTETFGVYLINTES